MRFLQIIVTAGALVVPGAVAAQEPVDSDPPAHVSFVDGAAVIERDGQADTAPANMPLLAGDRIRTQAGRVEILFADGSTLHVDNFTTVDFQSDELVRVLDGRVRLAIAGRPREVGYRIDGPNAWAQISQPGEYRFAITRNDRGIEVELAVLRGAAELVNDDGRTPLRAGERAFARAGTAPSYAYVFNSASWDAFDRWSESRRDYRLGLSSQYLPEPVRPYTRAFDQYGSWRHEPTYGYVWYPTVAVGWRPYYHGRWATLRPYGWVWVGNDPWAWPTHHYGRWGFSAGAWFWIPGRTWGPAWVSWGYSPGYVSWCPLGWNNRPVFSIVNLNVYSRGYDPWRAWTVVRRDHFGRDFVHRRVVAWDRLDARARGSWEFRDSAPEIVGHAVPRAQAPIRVVGRAVPRGSSGSAPVYTNLPRDGSRVQSTGPRIQVGESRSAGVPDRDPRSRAVPRGTAPDAPGVSPGRGIRSAPAARSDAGAADTPPERRAVPRATATDVPRMTPNRGVRSMPSIRSDAATPETSPRSRAVPRDSGGRDGATPATRPDGSGDAPVYRRAPMAQPRQPGAGTNDTEPRPDRGVRAIPRSNPVERGTSAPVMRSPYERRAPSAPAPETGPRPRDDGGWGGSRQPAERRAPEGWSGGGRAVPRNAPEARPTPSMPSPPRIERSAPPRIERSAPPSRSVDSPRGPDRSAPPARTAPRGGGGDRGQARRRDG
jgi:FecR protein